MQCPGKTLDNRRECLIFSVDVGGLKPFGFKTAHNWNGKVRWMKSGALHSSCIWINSVIHHYFYMIEIFLIEQILG